MTLEYGVSQQRRRGIYKHSCELAKMDVRGMKKHVRMLPPEVIWKFSNGHARMDARGMS